MQEHDMGSQFTSEVDRRSTAREKLGALVQSRTETLSLLTELAGRQPFNTEPSMEKALRRFCEALIDYTASAHFQLYRYLSDNRERRQSVLNIAEKIYPRIVETTDVILRFNDKYEAMSLDNSIEFLAIDLSNLGECLADRIQLEDRIIAAMSGTVH
jgi:regulator of sigma D